jgi:cell division protein FtsW
MTARKDNTVPNDIAMVVVLLMAIGTVFVFSASANIKQQFDLRRFYECQPLRQILFLPLAVLVMYAASCFNYRRLSLANGWLKSLSSYLLVVSVALLVLVLLPQFGTEINRARRWLRIPAGPVSVSFQPSELAKWALLFFLAAYCDKFFQTMRLYAKRFVPACLVIAVVVGLIITEDFGTAAFISLLAFLILLIGWARVLPRRESCFSSQ